MPQKECDGTCLSEHLKLDELPCEDGEILIIYWCFHDQTYILTTLAPPPNAEDIAPRVQDEDIPI